ncbi:MAG: hypothetical protein ABH869_08355 [Candidatus Omnitrophota bacterium]
MGKILVPEILTEFIEKETETLGYQIVDIRAKGGYRGVSLEIIIDKKDGITLGECGKFNKSIRSFIYKEKIFVNGYMLDVCSPGLDKELVSDTAFKWALGKQIIIIMKEPFEGKSEIIGKLLTGNMKEIEVLEDTQNVIMRIDRNDVAKVKLKVVL